MVLNSWETEIAYTRKKYLAANPSLLRIMFFFCNLVQILALFPKFLEMIFSFLRVKQKNNIGIKHGFSCINIRQVPWEVLKTEAKGRSFNTSQGTWGMLMHSKNMFSRYYCIKTENICYISLISCTILFYLFTDVSRTQFPQTVLVLRPDTTHFMTATILWPRYTHIESCVAVH